MDEVWLRFGIVATALALAIGVVVWRSTAGQKPRNIGETGLAAGLYLLTSSSCSTCGAARARLARTVGEEGYTEIAWEREAQVFTDLDIDAVPALLIVDESGDGRLHPGAPPASLAGL